MLGVVIAGLWARIAGSVPEAPLGYRQPFRYLKPSSPIGVFWPITVTEPPVARTVNPLAELDAERRRLAPLDYRRPD